VLQHLSENPFLEKEEREKGKVSATVFLLLLLLYLGPGFQTEKTVI